MTDELRSIGKLLDRGCPESPTCFGCSSQAPSCWRIDNIVLFHHKCSVRDWLMRILYAEGLTCRQIARRFGVGDSTVYRATRVDLLAYLKGLESGILKMWW
jgi:hypothetical protein